MMIIWLVFAASSCFAFKTLVILDNMKTKQTHSKFWDSLNSRGNELTFIKNDDSTELLIKYEEFLFDHLIFIAPTAESLPSQIKTKEILEFFDWKGNIIIFGGTDVGLASRRLANEFGFDFYTIGNRIYNDKEDFLIKTNNITFPMVAPADSLEFTATGLYMKKAQTLSRPLIVAPETAFAKNEVTKDTTERATGNNIVLGGIFQGYNNNRVSVLGSFDICSNKHWRTNQKFCSELTEWTFNAKGVLKYEQVTHHLKDEDRPKGYTANEYTIKDHIYYSIDIFELKNGQWVPFDSDEVYLEFVMLDPKIRKYLNRKGSTFYTEFMTPDHHGVYQFKTKFNEFGYSWVNTADEVALRHLRHDQFPRFIGSALPYYSSVFASIIGFFIFSFFFLYHSDKQKTD